MNKKQTSQTENSGAFSIITRKASSPRFWFSILFVVLFLIALETAASGDVGCSDRCQETLVGCLNGSGSDPVAEARCQDEYDDCGEGCDSQ